MHKQLSERTAVKYRGRMAANYERKRKRQTRWHLENKIVEEMISTLPPRQRLTVLDAPVGTGRFIPLYARLDYKRGWGMDTSEEMLAQARRKPGAKQIDLMCGNMLTDRLPNADVTVCIRFLDLIDESAMQQAMMQLMPVTRHRIVLTIRLGKKYVLKSNTATHDEKKFKRLLRKYGWLIAEAIPIFERGWYVLKLERKS